MSKFELAKSVLSPVGKIILELESEVASRLSQSALSGRALTSQSPRDLLAAGGSLRSERIEPLKAAFKESPITYSAKPAEWSAYPQLRSGTVTGPDGTKIPIVERNLGRQKAQVELKAYAIHKMMPFSSHMPLTVERSPGVIVQERFGVSIEDWVKRQSKEGSSFYWSYDSSPQLFNQLFSRNRNFAIQLEQAQVQRSILGDFDSTPANFALSWLGKRPLVANLDMNQAFELAAKPAASNIANLRGHMLAKSSLERTSHFLKAISSKGKERELQDLGLKSIELQHMKSRAEWLLLNRRLP